MADQDIKDYIKHYLKKGYSARQLQQFLISQGYPDLLVSDTLHEVLQSQKPNVPEIDQASSNPVNHISESMSEPQLMPVNPLPKDSPQSQDLAIPLGKKKHLGLPSNHNRWLHLNPLLIGFALIVIIGSVGASFWFTSNNFQNNPQNIIITNSNARDNIFLSPPPSNIDTRSDNPGPAGEFKETKTANTPQDNHTSTIADNSPEMQIQPEISSCADLSAHLDTCTVFICTSTYNDNTSLEPKTFVKSVDGFMEGLCIYTEQVSEGFMECLFSDKDRFEIAKYLRESASLEKESSDSTGANQNPRKYWIQGNFVSDPFSEAKAQGICQIHTA